ncbi:hypothetical protein FRC11_009318 [Ceratobasidium sp. 423]|nr:hypothetical protein FRC11_009318 [Ceratobasidium sp. 423]
MVALQNFVVLALSALALAIPTPTTKTPDLFKRTISGSQGGTCGRTTFTTSDVEAAASAAASHIAEGLHINVWTPGFKFQEGCEKPFYEFPIFKSRVYDGKSPGPDRVVIGSVSGADAAFCGLMTHTGAGGNNFLQCEA